MYYNDVFAVTNIRNTWISFCKNMKKLCSWTMTVVENISLFSSATLTVVRGPFVALVDLDVMVSSLVDTFHKPNYKPISDASQLVIHKPCSKWEMLKTMWNMALNTSQFVCYFNNFNRPLLWARNQITQIIDLHVHLREKGRRLLNFTSLNVYLLSGKSHLPSFN